MKNFCDGCVYCDKGNFISNWLGNWQCKNPEWTHIEKNGKAHYPSCFSRHAISGFQENCVYYKKND